MPGGTTSLHPPGHYDQHKACWSSKYYTKRTETIVLTDTTYKYSRKIAVLLFIILAISIW